MILSVCSVSVDHHGHWWSSMPTLWCPGRPAPALLDSTAGASRGEASTPAVGIPIVDITAAVRNLREQSMAEHEHARYLRRSADAADERAEFMALLADTMDPR